MTNNTSNTGLGFFQDSESLYVRGGGKSDSKSPSKTKSKS